jgi:lipopolysaccharide transport system ATP-binding protein
MFAVHSRDANVSLEIDGPTWVECEIPAVTLAPGWYAMKLSLGGRGPTIDAVEDAAHFEVLPTDYFGNGRLPEPSQGVIVQRSTWSTEAVR